MRFLLILIAVFILVLFIRTLFSKPAKKPQSKRKNGETMVPCSQCGVHVPKSEAICSEPRFFCSTAHQQQWLEEQEFRQ